MSEETFFTIEGELTKYPLCDLYFQFDDDEPMLMREDCNGEFTMTIIPSETEQSIEFYANDKKFKIFLKPKP